MLRNDQIDALVERFLRRIAKQSGRGAVPANDGSRVVCIDNSVSDLIENPISQFGPIFHGCAPFWIEFRQLRLNTRRTVAPRVSSMSHTRHHLTVVDVWVSRTFDA